MDQLQKLLSKANAADKAELAILHNATISCARSYKEQPTAVNKRDWDAAREGLQQTIARLLPVYLPKAAVTSERAFERQADAREYLLDIGFKVSSGKFSQDSHLFTGVGRRILLSDLMAYAKQHLDPPAGADDFDELAREEKELDVKIKRAKLKREESSARKEDKNWFERSTVYEREGALVGQIMSEARHQLGKSVPALIALCQGDPKFEIDIAKHLEEALFSAFRTLYEAGGIDIAFAEEEGE